MLYLSARPELWTRNCRRFSWQENSRWWEIATFIGKRPQPLLWAGLEAACAKSHSNCMANALHHCVIFRGDFTKLWTANVSFTLSICLSVCMEILGSHWMDFDEICYVNVFRISIKKFQVSLKSVKNNGYCTQRPMYNFYFPFVPCTLKLSKFYLFTNWCTSELS